MRAGSSSVIMLVVWLVSALLGACARDVTAVYPGRGSPGGAGSVVIELSNPARDLTVAINGAMVAKRAHSRRVLVTGVPAGVVTVDVAFGGGADAANHHITEIEVVPGEETAVVLPGPERSMAGAVQIGLYSLGSWIFLGLVYHALIAKLPGPKH